MGLPRKINVEDGNEDIKNEPTPETAAPEERFFDSSNTIHENLPHDDTPMTGGPYDPTATIAPETPPMQPQPHVEGEDA